MRYLVLAHTLFKKFAKEEIRQKLPNAKFEDLFEGNFIADVNCSTEDILKLGKDAIFINNLFPIHYETKGSDIKKLVEELSSHIVPKLLKRKTFRIETLTYGSEIHSRDLEVKLGTKLEEEGYVADLKDGEYIIFIVVYNNRYFVGILNKVNAIYKHISVAKRFSREKNRLNRAQYKLVEALERFNLDLPGGTALDIGAAPGGWSKVLAERGYKVYAVDPAELDKEVKQNPNVVHIKSRIENLKLHEKFDLIVNDMNIDPRDSAKIMNELAKYLKQDGYALFTLKLVKKQPSRLIKEVSEILTNYKIVKIKHLFQNRQELTVLLKKAN